ncbi:serine carboxypeptidase-like 40 [Andrographis paniculata]|uniref:serine carboxypeptidase-like 40 n=1 Tax=Andrographis paniculata TaxID=175694 RepID=UPI0021E88EC8|nr:serine carboxypeptidase-like 40 [Andrographis paniculata]
MNKPTAAVALHYTLLLVFLSTSQTAAAYTQSEALSRIYQAKLSKTGIVDTARLSLDDEDAARTPAHEQQLKIEDEIERLPGQPPVEFKQYGGYVTVDRAAGRAFYYYFVEAEVDDHHSQKQKQKQKLPLLLWLNGGPGCSSLGYGAMQELGPFRVHSDGKTLYNNPFAWIHAANVLFVESPAGVGFSYSNTTADYDASGDKRTAIDNYMFLLNWFKRFPEYKNSDFYISGESYAGYYIPELAHAIRLGNSKPRNAKINLKGIIIGNGVMNDETDQRGMYEYFGSHALSADETIDTIMKYCNFSPDEEPQSNKCLNALYETFKNIDSIDIYSIYSPTCSNSNLTDKPKKASIEAVDPCMEHYVSAYLNRLDVQKALHAKLTKWQACSNLAQKWQDSPSTVIPLHKEFLSDGIRVWIYSGDTDGRIPVTSTKKSIKTMNLATKTSWCPWYLGNQVGGYRQVYSGNLTFVTVRGAGHQVPTYQPAAALSLIQHFLAGTPLPT